MTPAGRAACLLLLLLAACQHYEVKGRGRAFTSQELSKLKPGVSRKRDARTVLGTPDRRDATDPDRQEWEYCYTLTQEVDHLKIQGRNLDDRVEGRCVVLRFDLYGVLTGLEARDVAFKLDDDDTRGGPQWGAADK